MKCIVCKNEVKTFGTGIKDCDETEFLENGGFVTFDFGYGSRHDLEIWSGVICDNCFENVKDEMKLEKDGF